MSSGPTTANSNAEDPEVVEPIELVELPALAPARRADVDTIATSITSLEAKVKDLVIEDQDGLDRASEIMVAIKTGMKAIEANMGPMKASTNTAHKTACGLFNKLMDPLKKLDRMTKSKVQTHVEEKEAAARREDIRLKAEAKKKEEERVLAEAATHEEVGDTEAAEETLSQPVPHVQAAVPKAEKPKASNMGIGREYTAELTDVGDFLEGLVDENPNALAVFKDPGVITKMESRATGIAKMMKGEARIPGFTISSKPQISNRG